MLPMVLINSFKNINGNYEAGPGICLLKRRSNDFGLMPSLHRGCFHYIVTIKLKEWLQYGNNNMIQVSFTNVVIQIIVTAGL